MPFLLPDADVVSILDAPPTPLASPSPGERFIVLVHYEAHPPIRLLARPRLRLAGLRLDPGLRARQRTRRFTGLSVLRVEDGINRPVALPPGAQVSVPVWAPDGRRFAFTIDEPDGAGVWTFDAATDGDPVQVPGLRVSDVLGAEPPGLGGTVRWSRDGRSLFALGVPPHEPPAGEPPAGAAAAGSPAPEAGTPQVEPRVEEVAGKRSQMATFQDLLTTPADEDRFEELATTAPLRVDPATGATVQLGPEGLYQYVAESPDGRYLLVYRLQRPFSFRVPYGYFARRVEVWTAVPARGDDPPEPPAASKLVTVVADLPVSDEVPRMGVPTGPRQVSWDERAPARLLWTEALDGGDPVAPAESRDAIMRQEAPFDRRPERAFLVRHRCLGWANLDEPDSLLLTERDRDRRWLTTWRCDLADPADNTVVFDIAEDDDYADPGAPVMRLHPDGTRTVRQRGSSIYLRGDGATPDGERPFLDRRDLATGETVRLFSSPAGAHETVLCLADGADGAQEAGRAGEADGAGDAGRADGANRAGSRGGEQVVIWHESPAEPPSLWALSLDEPGSRRLLAGWPDPHPQLTRMGKRLIVTDRGDGVQLSGLLHTPPGYDPGRDGPLPLVLWAYPHDFGTAATAGQVRSTTNRFTRLTASDPAWFVLRGCAVLADATMPVIGDPETKNDSYIEQVTAAAAAHIKALTEAGIADPARVAVGGHSYGAFMTANLLAHTDMFAAGIARSGAYNRTLTPFGFQTERRSLWEVPEVYDRVSPLRYANQISAPILLVHGADDANSGTFPVQSERLFQAIGGNGGIARLVILPLESHGYVARESVLHVLAEQFGWLDRWLGLGTAGRADFGPGDARLATPGRADVRPTSA